MPDGSTAQRPADGASDVGMRTVLVVDGANVVGSRPDGWWRDRPGAAVRLHEQLAGADLPFDDVVLVVEGAARRGPTENDRGRVRTVHAAGSGDDTIVALVRDLSAERREVVVVSADRALRRRVEQHGAGCRGPGWLRDRL